MQVSRWVRNGKYSLQSACGRYRITKTGGPRCAGGVGVTAYGCYVAGPSLVAYASIGWTLLDYHDTADQAKQSIEDYASDCSNTRQQLHPNPVEAVG